MKTQNLLPLALGFAAGAFLFRKNDAVGAIGAGKNIALDKKVKQYIIDAIDCDAYDVKCVSDEDKLRFLAATFKREYAYPENIKYYGSYQNAFANWLMGLPSAINVDFENYQILKIAKAWGSLPANASEKQEDKILSNWWNFIAAKTFQLFRKHNISVYN